jgi:broad specificity polyphosphatase/5'/3'-nucleotidase SurE
VEVIIIGLLMALAGQIHPEGTDLRAIYDGYISITPIHTNLTNTSEIKVLKKKFLNSK